MKRTLYVAAGIITFVLVGTHASALPPADTAPAISPSSASRVSIIAQRASDSEDSNTPALPLLIQSSELDSISPSPELSAASSAPSAQQLSSTSLVNALREGGYIILLRHAQTEQDYRDHDSAKMGNCATQRMLSAAGWQQARRIGQAFETLNIPVGAVYSSEYCRAWQTADLAFGYHETRPALNSRPDMDSGSETDVREVQSQIMPFLTALPATGTNTILVSHYDVFSATVGINLENQGTAYIIKPDGQGSYEIIARVEPDDWEKLPQP